MASIKRLFDEITIIRPDKISQLGIEGLEEELLGNFNLLAKEIWDALPLKSEHTMPETDSWVFIPAYCGSDALTSHFDAINESIRKTSILLNAIQEHTQDFHINVKRSVKMPAAFKDNSMEPINHETAGTSTNQRRRNRIESGCEAMGVPCSMDNFIEYGEMLFSSYQQAAAMMEDFIRRTAKMVMTEEEIKDLVEDNEYRGVYLPSLYDDEDRLRNLCNLLVNHGFLDKSTSVDDFTYFFSGKGTPPKQCLIWQGNNVELATFIDCYFVRLRDDFPKRWKVVQKIFNKKNLRQTLNNFLTATNQELINKRNQIFYDMLD